MSGVRRESVSHASRTVCLFHGAECVVGCRMCGCVYVVLHCVVLINNNMPALLAFPVIIILMIILRKKGYYGTRFNRTWTKLFM